MDLGITFVVIGGLCSGAFCISYSIFRCIQHSQENEKNIHPSQLYKLRAKKQSFFKKQNSVFSWDSATTNCDYSISSYDGPAIGSGPQNPYKNVFNKKLPETVESDGVTDDQRSRVKNFSKERKTKTAPM